MKNPFKETFITQLRNYAIIFSPHLKNFPDFKNALKMFNYYLRVHTSFTKHYKSITKNGQK